MSYNTSAGKVYKKNTFQCNYCPRSFSRHGAYRNHLRSHRDQMYLDENNLTREKNIINEPKLTVARNTIQETTLSPISINESIIPFNEQTSGENVSEFWKVKILKFDVI